jgi:hypothetical protein
MKRSAESAFFSPESAPRPAQSEMERQIAALAWGSTAIGPQERWSPALRTTVRILLANRFPMLLWWGPDYISIYNDAYIPILGQKHPWGLGKPVRECWSEIWDVLRPLIDTPFFGGPSTWSEDIELHINRSGFTEETHFTVAYSPVPDETAERGIATGTVIGSRSEERRRSVQNRGGKTGGAPKGYSVRSPLSQRRGRHSIARRIGGRGKRHGARAAFTEDRGYVFRLAAR